MRFKIDENLPGEFVEMLRGAQHDAQSVLDEGLGGAPDTRLAEVCRSERRAIVTLDLDFADIRAYPPHEQAGLIVTRVEDQRKRRVLTVFEQVGGMLETEEVAGPLVAGAEGRGGEGGVARVGGTGGGEGGRALGGTRDAAQAAPREEDGRTRPPVRVRISLHGHSIGHLAVPTALGARSRNA